jgi:hypothetical protein
MSRYRAFARFAPEESITEIYMHNVLVDFKIINRFFISKGLSEFECMETMSGIKEIITTLKSNRSEFLQLLKNAGVRTDHKTLSDDEVESIANGICQFVNYYQSQDTPLPSFGGGTRSRRRQHRKKSRKTKKRRSQKKRRRN